ncbi:tetraspanin-2 [Phtheirospermum japonicum]|uniref:Tetraspanin-2 n=1 Tax=Phtheirospermum japonicum TaxID=374723 RepID=A0A830BCU9_9LAMI|nr:tetraspanin-2 [Phtheirospermum japonicum]
MARLQARQRVHPLAPLAARRPRCRLLPRLPRRIRRGLPEEARPFGRLLGVHVHPHRAAPRGPSARVRRHAPERRVHCPGDGVSGVQACGVLVVGLDYKKVGRGGEGGGVEKKGGR